MVHSQIMNIHSANLAHLQEMHVFPLCSFCETDIEKCHQCCSGILLVYADPGIQKQVILYRDFTTVTMISSLSEICTFPFIL